ncbi:unnamed protein product [Lactuca virosa]|uniref:CCHC-type domain-containing protein n=1 Tax=Lactuca virosa TaxID=75947 RepID=A0AAU9LRZ8_9ASTR|nr:unnamed protein product [Lactuca virosa]
MEYPYMSSSVKEDESFWEEHEPQTEFIKPLPPVSRRMPGRPKVNRRRHVSENDGRVHTPRTVRCGKCFEYGHNQKGCKNATREPVAMPPKKKRRPRKEQCEPS